MNFTTFFAKTTPRHTPQTVITLVGLLLLATLAFLVLASPTSPAVAQTLEPRSILGRIDNVEDHGNGLTVITVQEQSRGRLQLEIRDELTIVEVPSQERSLGKDLRFGSTIAALALERVGVTNVNTASDAELQGLPQIGPARSQAILNYRASNGAFRSVDALGQVPGLTANILDTIRPQVVVNDWLLTQQIMSKPDGTVLHFHVTGVVVQLTASELSVLDADGHLLTLALTLGGASGISPGEPITVAVRHDPKQGTYTAVDIDRVDDALDRLTAALVAAEAVGDAENATNLRLRLVDAVGRVNAALRQAVDRYPAVRQAVQSYTGELQTLLRAFDLYGPVVTATGVVDLVDTSGGWLGITDVNGDAIDLKLVPETVLRDGPMDIDLNQELFGRRVTVTFDPNPDSLRAHRIDLVRDTGLPQHIIDMLADTANEGEAEGTVIEVNELSEPGYIIVQLDDGRRLPLTVVPTAGYVTGLASFQRQRVAVRYDTHTFDLLYIQSSRPGAGETPIAGVILDLDIKESRQIDIAVPGGTVLTVTWVANSEVTRDSLSINPSDISIGDVVRPTSRYVPSDVTFLAVRNLDLISPVASIRGPVLGVDVNASRVTVLPRNGQLITIKLDNTTQIERNGEPSSLDSVQPTERLAYGSLYNPLNSEASRLIIEPAKVARVSGSITDVDLNDFILTVRPDGVDYELVLLVPNKPRVVILDGDTTVSFADLRVGDRVDNLIYRYDDEIVVELMVSSR